jgi:hypothetical protein
VRAPGSRRGVRVLRLHETIPVREVVKRSLTIELFANTECGEGRREPPETEVHESIDSTAREAISPMSGLEVSVRLPASEAPASEARDRPRL